MIHIVTSNNESVQTDTFHIDNLPPLDQLRTDGQADAKQIANHEKAIQKNRQASLMLWFKQAERCWIAAKIHGLKGDTFVEFAADIGIDRSTGYELVKLHPHSDELIKRFETEEAKLGTAYRWPTLPAVVGMIPRRDKPAQKLASNRQKKSEKDKDHASEIPHGTMASRPVIEQPSPNTSPDEAIAHHENALLRIGRDIVREANKGKKADQSVLAGLEQQQIQNRQQLTELQQKSNGLPHPEDVMRETDRNASALPAHPPADLANELDDLRAKLLAAEQATRSERMVKEEQAEKVAELEHQIADLETENDYLKAKIAELEAEIMKSAPDQHGDAPPVEVIDVTTPAAAPAEAEPEAVVADVTDPIDRAQDPGSEAVDIMTKPNELRDRPLGEITLSDAESLRQQVEACNKRHQLNVLLGTDQNVSLASAYRMRFLDRIDKMISQNGVKITGGGYQTIEHAKQIGSASWWVRHGSCSATEILKAAKLRAADWKSANSGGGA